MPVIVGKIIIWFIPSLF